jgi:hypothetical protein
MGSQEGNAHYLDSEIGVRQTDRRDWIAGRLAIDDEQDPSRQTMTPLSSLTAA